MSYLFTKEQQTEVTEAIKKSVRLASNATNYNLAATHTAVDGVTLNDGDRVLLKDQTTASENGIYVWASGTQLFSRADDALDGKVSSGLLVGVEEGVQTTSVWTLSTANPITVGVTNLTFQLAAITSFRSQLFVESTQEVNGVEVTKFLAKFSFLPSEWEPAVPMEFRFGAILAVSNGALTGEVQLYNLTDAEQVTLTGGTLTTSSTSFVKVESGALVVGSAAGNLKDTEKVYEVRITNDGTLVSEKTFLGSAWLRIG